MYPYKNNRYGGALSFTQGMMDSFMEYQKMRYMMGQQEIMNQYRQSLMGQHERQAERYALEKPWLEARAEAGRKTLAGETLTEGEKTLFGRTTMINLTKPFTPGTTKSIGDIAKEVISTVPIEDKTIKEEDLSAKIEDIKKQTAYDTRNETEKQQIDATIDVLVNHLKNSGYEIQSGQQESLGFKGRLEKYISPFLRAEETISGAIKGAGKLWNKYTGSATKAGVFAAQKIQGKPSEQELANIPSPNMNNPFVKGKPPAPDEAMDWPPETQGETDKPYRDEIMRVWYSMPSLLQYEIWEALDAGKTYEEIINTGKLKPWLR